MRPVALDHYSDRHPVAHMIATGSYWVSAWLAQKSTPLAALARTTGIPIARLSTISTKGTEVSRAEIDALARAWSVSSEDLIRSIDGACAIVD